MLKSIFCPAIFNTNRVVHRSTACFLFIAAHKINTPISQSLPHIGCLVVTELNWNKPSLHLNEGLVKFGLVEAIMVLSSAIVLDQIARFFIFLSNVPSYWYSLNKSCDNEFNLANHLSWIKTIMRRFLLLGI